MNEIRFHVNTRLAKLLSENYRSSEKALKELIDNAWDAEADTVKITLPEPLTEQAIIIQDDGSGMTENELRQEYLFIANDRRIRRGEITKNKKRKAKGRKGIGKFAGLMAASSMKLETWARGRKCTFVLTKEDYGKAEDIEKLPINLDSQKDYEIDHGTRITLTGLNQGFTFPNADKLRQILLHEYGREEDFNIEVDGKLLGIDDVKGAYTEYEKNLPDVGKIRLRFTISNQRKNLRAPGISIRVDGKIVGKPEYFGLEEANDFPPKLLKKLYGEIEIDGLIDHVTADWGALVENSELFEAVKKDVFPVLREKFKQEYGQEISLAQARLQKRINQRLQELPEYKRKFAEQSIKSILERYYGEPESKVEPIVSVLLDALERTDYRTILEYINEASHSDIAKLAEVLNQFGLIELAIIGEQANSRLIFLEKLDYLCRNSSTEEKNIHDLLAKNLWVFGLEYSFFSSNITLKRQVEDLLGKTYSGKRANKRPDLLLNMNADNKYLLIEFKRPNHSLTYTDYQQATGYRNDFLPFIENEIKVLVIGGKKGNDLLNLKNHEPNTDILTFSEMISKARNQLNWLLKQLGADTHA